MKNKMLRLGMVLLLSSVVFSACKKYEEGPGLSLKSKNARLTGEWELTEYSYTRTTEEGTTTRKFEGSLMMFTGKEYNGWDYVDTTYSYPYSMKLTIEKEGTYEWYEIEDGEIDEWTAYWSWMDGKSGKELLLLSDDGTFKINKLKNKELILVNDYSYSGTYNGNLDFSETERTWTFEKK